MRPASQQGGQGNRGAYKLPAQVTPHNGLTGKLAGQLELSKTGRAEDISATNCAQQRPPAKVATEADQSTHNEEKTLA